MQRRSILLSSGVAAATLMAAHTSAQAQPAIRWRMTSSFPKTLDTLFGTSEFVCRRVSEMTDEKFQIQLFAPGELVAGNAVLDAVGKGVVDAGHTASNYYTGKDPSFAFDSVVPFGMNSRQQSAWMIMGDGKKLMRNLFKEQNIYNVPCGNIGTQMGGWFRKEIKTVADLKGLKIRLPGLGGDVMAKLGALPQQIPGSDIYPALERGTIDAVEWIGPYDDEKLGFNQVAKYYYTPSWWEGGGQCSMYVNLDKWNELPKEYRAVFEAACAEGQAYMQAMYDTLNPPALRRLIAKGTQVRPFSNEIMTSAYAAAESIYEEISAKNPRFKEIYDNWKAFRNSQIQWLGVAERRFDNMMATVIR
ncbi:TRAP transporter substrate-binding protein [Simplicispira suum]|uniref:ABC transporter substrate-binding protein n=1 Tax=Simplicispira suum TaxID=2109915 RepID=A0A2S0N5Y2_9BURK|nr:TRAP transporter substrate-binding protein [Simplicispira suum]AVO43548.1 ABC transporter substrate-binding protein [Simplicispira suum]